MPKRFRTITKRAESLLNCEEGFDVDFKQNEKVDPEDLVAFANSLSGGALLLGVEEAEDETGRQIGKILGLSLNDKIRLSVLNKASTCTPPVELEIFEENSAKVPFIRIEIPSSRNKPHCTAKGTYKIRGDGLNNSLLPNEILQMFLANETSQFIHRFRQAADQLQEQVEVLMSDVKNQFGDLHDSVAEIRDNIKTATYEIASEAVTSSEETTGVLYQAREQVGENAEAIDKLGSDVAIIWRKLDSLLIHCRADDLSTEMMEKELGLYLGLVASQKGPERARLLNIIYQDYPTIPKDRIQQLLNEKA